MKKITTSFATLVTLLALAIAAVGCAVSPADSDEPVGAADEALSCEPYPGVDCTDDPFKPGFACTCGTRESCAWLAAACSAVYGKRLDPIAGGGYQCTGDSGGGLGCPF